MSHASHQKVSKRFAQLSQESIGEEKEMQMEQQKLSGAKVKSRPSLGASPSDLQRELDVHTIGVGPLRQIRKYHGGSITFIDEQLSDRERQLSQLSEDRRKEDLNHIVKSILDSQKSIPVSHTNQQQFYSTAR